MTNSNINTSGEMYPSTESTLSLKRPEFFMLVSLISLLVALGLRYIYRTSIFIDGTLYFVLWDDAMISMQYAKNFVNGYGLVWSVGSEPVQGFTNLGTTLIMAILHLAGFSASKVSLVFQLLNLVLLVICTIITFNIIKAYYPANKNLALSAPAAIVFCFPLLVFSLQGSDTGLVSFWLFCMLAIFTKFDLENRAWPLSAYFLLGIGIYLRIDTLILIMPFLLVLLLNQQDKNLRVFFGGAICGLILLSTLIFNYYYYDDILPNTYYLKATGQPKLLMIKNGLYQVLHWMQFWSIAIIPALYASYKFRSFNFIKLFSMIILSAFSYSIWVGGDIQPAYGIRFLIPSIPLLLLLAAIGIDEFLSRGKKITVLIIFLVFSLSNGAHATKEILQANRDTMLKVYNKYNLENAIFYRNFTTPSTTIALHWAGTISYFSNRPVYDVLGKSDKHIARLHVDFFSPGHSKWDWQYVLTELKPDIFNAYSRGLENQPGFKSNYLEARIPDSENIFYIHKDKLNHIQPSDH